MILFVRRLSQKDIFYDSYSVSSSVLISLNLFKIRLILARVTLALDTMVKQAKEWQRILFEGYE